MRMVFLTTRSWIVIESRLQSNLLPFAVYKPEAKFLNFEGARKSIPRNLFRQPV